MDLGSTLTEILNIDWPELSKEVKEKTKILLIDHFGAALGGVQAELSDVAQRYVLTHHSQGNTTVLSPSLRSASLSGSVFANATFASALDIDDGYRLAAGHPGSSVIPVALAVGEELDVSGKDFLSSVVTGYEIATRTGKVTYSKPEDRFFGSGTWASVGAAAAAARLYDLSTEKFVQSLGITEAHTPLSPNMKSIANGSMVKESIGWGALTGLNGALLAREGFTGVVPEIIADNEKADLESIGEKFLLLDIYLKPYASCRWTQPAIEGLRKIKRENEVMPGETSEIIVETFEKALSLNNPHPETSVAAQYSLPFVLAAYYLDEYLGPEQISSKAIGREDIRSLAEKVSLEVNDEIERRFPKECLSQVTIKMSDGSEFSSGVLKSRGTPDNPLSKEEVRAKFRRLSTGIMAKHQQSLILDGIDTLEKHDLRDIIRNFTFN